MRIALAQINPVIADITGNRYKIFSYIKEAREKGADLVIFPEMATIGYPPMDLLENDKLVRDNLASLDQIAKAGNGIDVICGYVEYDRENPPYLHNAAAYIRDGMQVSSHFKTLLPTYDVFDELRYFSPARSREPEEIRGARSGITVCEDIWNVHLMNESRFTEHRRYDLDPVEILAGKGINTLINISASPFVKGKNRAKKEMLTEIAKQYGITVVYVNQVGGNDSLIFDGNSMVIAGDGRIIGKSPAFTEELTIVDTESREDVPVEYHELEDIRQALVLGIRDYMHKCGFTQALLGLSGGIDSALTATLAVQALGPENVMGITMPSMYSSTGSVDDSVKLAENLGIILKKVPIRDLYDRYIEDLDPLFAGMPEDTTEENIQARIRGNILMAVSNKTGRLLLSTGNKSELAMGYCTLYGDMSGGLAVISDLPKTLVYALARHINERHEIIPENTVTKPPSAELRAGQKDQDTLPPYEVLDRILELYIEQRRSAEGIIAEGFDSELVRQVLRAVNMNEYKRIQAAPGLKVTTKAFGQGRRIPIAQRFEP